MYIVDTHCDSLIAVSADRGLVNKHNLSAKEAQLQLFAEFVPKDGMPPEYRRKRVFNLLDVYIAECQRLGIFPVRDCQEPPSEAGQASQPAQPHPAKEAPCRAAQGQKRTCLCPSLGCLSSLEKVGAQAPGFWELRL